MGKKFIYDSWGDVVSVIQHDEAAKTTTFAQFQDMQPYFEENKRLQTLNDGYNKKRDLRRVASIPNVLLVKWLRDDGIDVRSYFRKPKAYSHWLRRKIYNSENSFVLTAPHKAR